MPHKKRNIAVIIAFAAFAAGTALSYRHALIDTFRKLERGPIPAAVSYQDIVKADVQVPATTAEKTDAVPGPAKDLPTSLPPALVPAPKPAATAINLKVPFILQAPYQIWDEIHEDACEEASAAMIAGFYKGETSYTQQQMEARILAIVDYENATYGSNRDTDAARTAEFMLAALGLNASAVPISSISGIKTEVAAGRPVIVPAFGKALHNPNFKNGGPEYHMLVVKGYTSAGKIITNDPGTRNGPDYVYDPEILWNAVHDWNDGDVPNGKKVMIVVR